MTEFLAISPVPPRAGLRAAIALARDVLAVSGRRFWGILLLAALLAVAQGGSFLLLYPILALLGLAGSGAIMPVFAEIGAGLGLAGALGLYLLLIALLAVLMHFHSLAVLRLVLDYGDRLRARLYAAALEMGWEAARALRPAALAHSLTTEVSQAAWGGDQLLRTLALLLQAPIILAVALLFSPVFTALALVFALAGALVLLPLNRRSHALATQLVWVNRALSAEVADEFAGLRILKVLGAERGRSDEFFRQVADLRALQIAQARAFSLAARGQMLLAAALAAGAVWGGTALLALSLAEVLVLLVLFGRLVLLVQRGQDYWRQLLRVLPHFATVSEQIATYRDKADPPPAVAPRLTRAVSLEAVGYRYDPSAPWAVRGVTARLPAGQITVLTGASGAGKSTLADLIMGLTEAQEGAIRIDETPLHAGVRVAWRQRVAYVPQDPFLFHDTIRANLRLADPAADDARLWAALERAAAGFVRDLPQGLDTRVGERGARLSGGERQRVALARALLQTPDLLVLDEATSALDDAAEAQILDALRPLAGQVTLLIIAHRSTSLALAQHRLHLAEDGTLEMP